VCVCVCVCVCVKLIIKKLVRSMCEGRTNAMSVTHVLIIINYV